MKYHKNSHCLSSGTKPETDDPIGLNSVARYRKNNKKLLHQQFKVHMFCIFGPKLVRLTSLHLFTRSIWKFLLDSRRQTVEWIHVIAWIQTLSHSTEARERYHSPFARSTCQPIHLDRERDSTLQIYHTQRHLHPWQLCNGDTQYIE